MDIKIAGNEEVIKETITEKLRNVDEVVPVRKWRFIWGSRDGDSEKEKKDLKEKKKNKYAGGTIYSLNWIPLGGFVKIKGEGGEDKEAPDSFAGKSAWKRIKVLAAGVIMNFILAWLLISVGLMIGAPEAIDSGASASSSSKIQIAEVAPDSPASSAGIMPGDEILKTQTELSGQKIIFKNVQEVQDYINANKGNQINLEIRRGADNLNIKITPRIIAPAGQGALGVSLVETALVRFVWYQAIWNGFLTTLNLIAAIVVALGGIVGSLFMGKGVGADVAGPVGIAVIAKQAAGLGFVYILQFTALISINLGVINILPFPALDGGRILFILIEKIKGSPVGQKTEQAFHTAGFLLLILLLVLISFRDVSKLIK
jgi:regulator of sigma E protease